MCKWIHTSQSSEEHQTGQLPSSGVTTTPWWSLIQPLVTKDANACAPATSHGCKWCADMFGLFWEEKSPKQHNTPICHFTIIILFLMQEVHHKNKPWICSYFWSMDYVCFCFISQGLVAVLAWLRFCLMLFIEMFSFPPLPSGTDMD